MVGQIKAGGAAPDRVDAAPAGLGSSLGTLTFVPTGYAGAGKIAFASYNGGQFCLVGFTSDGVGTYNLGACGTTVNMGGGPEGIIYVPLGSALFANLSILVASTLLERYQHTSLT